MLDPDVCANLEIAEARVSLEALGKLRSLLTALGFDSLSDPNCAEKEPTRHGKSATQSADLLRKGIKNQQSRNSGASSSSAGRNSSIRSRKPAEGKIKKQRRGGK
jgi:hypothetical protein